MLENVMRHIRNWFVPPNGFHPGEYTIAEGSITLPFLLHGQYFRIVGSMLNDGVYKYPAEGLQDEHFTGEVWALAIPRAFLDLVAEIETWQAKNGGQAAGPYQSESFGGYSYTRATDSTTGGAVTWESAFRSRLNQWRKI